jgi:hypothetical protein
MLPSDKSSEIYFMLRMDMLISIILDIFKKENYISNCVKSLFSSCENKLIFPFLSINMVNYINCFLFFFWVVLGFRTHCIYKVGTLLLESHH